MFTNLGGRQAILPFGTHCLKLYGPYYTSRKKKCKHKKGLPATGGFENYFDSAVGSVVLIR